MATPKDLLSALARAFSLTGTRFIGDPEYAASVQDLMGIQEEVGWVRVLIGDHGFTMSGVGVEDEAGDLEELRIALAKAGIRELRLQQTASKEAWEEFLRRVHPSSSGETTLPSARFRGLEGQLGMSFRGGEGPLPGMSGQIESLFQGRTSGMAAPPPSPTVPAGTEGPSPEIPWDDGSPGPAPVPESSESPESSLEPVADGRAGATGAAPGAASGPPTSPAIFESPLYREVLKEVRDYLDCRVGDRRDEEARIRERVEELTRSRNAPMVSWIVEALVGSDRPEVEDQDALELAGAFVTPAVASQLVARLGATRDPEERGRLVRALSRIGREGALALVDALEEARDRFHRRSFMDAMVALGPLGTEMAERMVEDPRWFVVRNGVALLGELGGEGAVSHLTAALANPDGRVRRESVLSLAKVGGRDAEMLLLGMLGDADPEVRAKTCRALGMLGSTRAVRPLTDLLKDDHVDVQAESLQALGTIGDPGAVGAIEKKAFGGLLTRPPREVRIAAFRALSSIGTPGAMKALEKGAKDPDDGVRTVVKVLTGG